MLEMAALPTGRVPDWDGARRFIDSLVFEELEDDLLEMCGVDLESGTKEHWLAVVKERLRADLEAFRDDVESDRDEIERWELEDLTIFVSIGEEEDERAPDKGHGWMCRLLDAGALGAAGFRRMRKSEL